MTISRMIWRLANLRMDRGMAVTTHLSERSRIDILIGIAHSIFGVRPLYDELKAHLRHITDDVYPKRNEVIHGNWGYGADGNPEILAIKARGPVKIGPRQTYSVADISSIVDQIIQADDALEELDKRIEALLPTLSNWP